MTIGRPTKLTKELVEKTADALRRGTSIEAVAALVRAFGFIRALVWLMRTVVGRHELGQVAGAVGFRLPDPHQVEEFRGSR